MHWEQLASPEWEEPKRASEQSLLDREQMEINHILSERDDGNVVLEGRRFSLLLLREVVVESF